jgi:hypothetical protein
MTNKDFSVINLGDNFCAIIPPGVKTSLTDLMHVKKLYWQTSPRELIETYGTTNPLESTKEDFCLDPLVKCVSSLDKINGILFGGIDVVTL